MSAKLKFTVKHHAFFQEYFSFFLNIITYKKTKPDLLLSLLLFLLERLLDLVFGFLLINLEFLLSLEAILVLILLLLSLIFCGKHTTIFLQGYC